MRLYSGRNEGWWGRAEGFTRYRKPQDTGRRQKKTPGGVGRVVDVKLAPGGKKKSARSEMAQQHKASSIHSPLDHYTYRSFPPHY
jgi:hypothetical protein